LVLDEAIPTPRSGHFIQNASKLYIFVYSLVGTAPYNHIENPAASLWFVGYFKRTKDALSLLWFWMKQSQRQGAAILFRMLVN
jgi:hypothetical protein